MSLCLGNTEGQWEVFGPSSSSSLESTVMIALGLFSGAWLELCGWFSMPTSIASACGFSGFVLLA